MWNIVIILLPLFGLIGFGYVVGRSGIAHRPWITVLNLFGYYLAFPALILKSLLGSHLSLQLHGSMIVVQILFGLALMVGAFFIGHWLKLERDIKNSFIIGVYFANSGYIGVPALQLVFGDAAAAEGTVIVSVMIALTLTVGISLIEVSRRHHLRFKPLLKNLALNPLMWSIVLGAVVSVMRWPVPTVLNQMVQLMAASAAPTVLVSLGIFLAISPVKRQTLKLASIMVGLKMLLIPAALALGMWLLPNNDWLETTLIQGSMPIAVTAFALAQLYPMNKALMSTAIVLSTLSSFVVIPLVMWLAPLL